MFRLPLQISRAVSSYAPAVLNNLYNPRYPVQVASKIQTRNICNSLVLNAFNTQQNQTKNLQNLVKNYNISLENVKKFPIDKCTQLLSQQKFNFEPNTRSFHDMNKSVTPICHPQNISAPKKYNCDSYKKPKKKDVLNCVFSRSYTNKKPDMIFLMDDKKGQTVCVCKKIKTKKSCCAVRKQTSPCRRMPCTKRRKRPPCCQPENSCKKSEDCCPSFRIPSKQEIIERVKAYFRARPGCPDPSEWKQRLLEEKARRAAEAAGYQLCCCKPRCPPKKEKPKSAIENLKKTLKCIKNASKKPRPCPRPPKCKGRYRFSKPIKCSQITWCKNYPKCCAANKQSALD